MGLAIQSFAKPAAAGLTSASAAICFAGLAILIGPPVAWAAEDMPATAISHSGASNPTDPGVRVRPVDGVVRVVKSPLDLTRLEPEAFADWEPRQASVPRR